MPRWIAPPHLERIELGFEFGTQARQRVHAHVVFARRRAQREQPLLLSVPAPRIDIEPREQATPVRAAPPAASAKRGFQRGLRGLRPLRAPSFGIRDSRFTRSPAGLRAALARDEIRGRGDILGEPVGVHQQRARRGESASSPARGASWRSSSRGVREIFDLGGRVARPRVSSPRASSRAAASAARSRGNIGGERVMAAERVQQARDGWRCRTGRDRRAGHGLRPATPPISRASATPTGSSLTKARLRPSADSVRRRMISSV